MSGTLSSANLSFDQLNHTLEERGNRIRCKFGEEIIKGIHDTTLLAILKVISDGRKDVLRPALTSFSCEAVGGKIEDATLACLMFTLASTGFSIHDDIIDKSPNKHLRETILGKYGINKSLLVGDLLITKGWALMGGMLQGNHNPEKMSKIMETYGNLCNEMCEAEFMENFCKKKVDTDIEYQKSILWGAMAETEACARIGALIGDGSMDEVAALSDFGRRLGFTARLIDEVKDVLNVDGSLIHRLKYESVPLPLLFAAKSSEDRRQKIKSIIDGSNFSASSIRVLLELCFDSDAFTYVFNMTKKNVDATTLCLEPIKPSFSRDILSLMNEKLYVDFKNLLLR